MKNYFYYLNIFLFFGFFSVSLHADNCSVEYNAPDLCSQKNNILQRCQGKDNLRDVQAVLDARCGELGERSETECVAGNDSSRQGTRQTGSGGSAPASGASGANR